VAQVFFDLTSNEEANKFRIALNDWEMRNGVAVFLAQVLGPLDQWRGLDGSISIIQCELNNLSGSRDMTHKVLQ
jgi:hypothetical protein